MFVAMADLEFRFTIDVLPDGTALTAEEMERFILAKLEDSGGTSKQALWDLASLYSQTGHNDRALDCIQRLVAIADDVEERASCVLAMGQLHERVGDFAEAARFYRVALDLTPGSTTTTWYWIHNNLGYSLNQLGQHEEAAALLRSAIAIDPSRPNAFKNLALALVGQQQHAAATEYFLRATQTNAADPRSLNHLEELIAAHPELLLAVPDLQTKLEACRVAVHNAAAAQPDFNAHWTRLRQKPRD